MEKILRERHGSELQLTQPTPNHVSATKTMAYNANDHYPFGQDITLNESNAKGLHDMDDEYTFMSKTGTLTALTGVATSST